MIRLPKIAQLQPRERLLAVGCGVVLLVVMLDQVVIRPWTKHAKTIRQEIARMEESLQVQQRLLARRDRILAELEQYARYRRPIIADDQQMAALLKEIEEFATRSEVELTEIKPLAVESDATARRYPLEFRFRCTTEQWVELVYQIETSPSLFEIVRAGMSLDDEEPDRLDAYLRLVSAIPIEQPSSPGAGETGDEATALP